MTNAPHDFVSTAGHDFAAGHDFPPPVKERGDAVRLRGLLEGELRSDRWQVGERLPTERELGFRYGVARNTVRRALDSLETAQLIVRHVGRGTFKAGMPDDDPVLRSVGLPEADLLSPADVIECRLLFEPGLAGLVVARASHADFDRMEQCLRNADGAASVPEFELWDAALHDAIALASRNQALIAVARSLARVRRQSDWGTIKSSKMTPDRMARLHTEHRSIVDALRARDKDTARDRIRDHIRHVQRYMFEEE